MNCHSGRLGGDAQRLRELAVVDLMILRRKQRAGDFSGKMRLSLARGRGRNPLQRQTEFCWNSRRWPISA
jgi:hypothetical protein